MASIFTTSALNPNPVSVIAINLFFCHSQYFFLLNDTLAVLYIKYNMYYLGVKESYESYHNNFTLRKITLKIT